MIESMIMFLKIIGLSIVGLAGIAIMLFLLGIIVSILKGFFRGGK